MQRRGAKATKKLGAGEGAYLAGFFHVFLYTMVTLTENHILESALYKSMILHTF